MTIAEPDSELTWVVANLTRSATPEQIRSLITMMIIEALECGLQMDNKDIALQGMKNIYSKIEKYEVLKEKLE